MMQAQKRTAAEPDARVLELGWTPIRHGLVAMALVVPWLNPFAPSPSPGVLPWLLSALCCLAAAAFGGGLRWVPALSTVCLLSFACGLLWRTPTLANDSLAVPGAMVLMGLASALGAQASKSAAIWRLLVLAWATAALTSSVIGLLQYVGAASFFAPWVNASPPGEAFANLRQRNQLASLINIGMVSVLSLTTQSKASRSWVIAAIMLLAAGNAATASRTGMLELLMVILLAWVWNGSRDAWWLVLALAVYVLTAMLLPLILEWRTGQFGGSTLFRFLQDRDCGSRAVLWSNVFDLIREKPLWGWGWGELDYAHYTTLYEGPRFCDILDNAHDLPLHLAVELGVPFSALAVLGAIYALLHGKPWREANPQKQTAFGVLAIILLHSLLEYPLWYGPFQLALGLCLGLLWPSHIKHPLRFPATSIILAIVFLASSSYALWDYHRIGQIYRPPEQRSDAYRSDTLNKIRGSWLFRRQVQFAELTTTSLTAENAERLNGMALELLHFSPEPRVIEKVIESAVLLGKDGEARFHIARYRAAFPQAHALWAQGFAGKPL